MLTPEIVMLSTAITVLITAIALVKWAKRKKKLGNTPDKTKETKSE